MTTIISDETFKEVWLNYKGSVVQIAKHFNRRERHIYKRRNDYEAKHGVQLPSGDHSRSGRSKEYVSRIGERINLTIKDGIIPVGGDGHYWPGDASVAHKAFVSFVKTYQPPSECVHKPLDEHAWPALNRAAPFIPADHSVALPARGETGGAIQWVNLASRLNNEMPLFKSQNPCPVLKIASGILVSWP